MRTARRTHFYDLSKRVIDHMVEQHGLTLTQVAAICHVDKSFISRARKAERELSTGHIRRLADHLDMPYGAFLMATEPAGEVPEKWRKLYDMAQQVMRQADRVESAIDREQEQREAAVAAEQAAAPGGR